VTRIAVAICARADAPTAAAIDALTIAGVRDPIVERAVAGHGLAQARNAALARCDAPVIAYIDDDIVVGPGWFDALQRAWMDRRALGSVGGSIRPRFVGTRPLWLTDGLLGVLGIGHGDTFHGGNVSFCTDALRGIGGFSPVRGTAALRDWFSEEHHAQRELARAGWASASEVGAIADRLIDTSRLQARDVLELRARYGARSALIGERRPRRVAARTVARSAAGTAVAVTKGNVTQAIERGARLTENAGVLLAPLIAHRDLQPVARQTPFIYSVPPPQPLVSARRRVLSRTEPLVLVYHRVDEGHGAGVSPANFGAQLEVLCDRRAPARLEDIVGGEAPRDAVAVTMDDGYAETSRHVQPMLEAVGFPATVFVSTWHTREQQGFWWDEVHRLLRSSREAPLRLTIDGQTRAWVRPATAERHVVGWLQPIAPEVIHHALRDLRTWARSAQDLPEAERPLTIEELRALARSPLIEVGAHTRTHPNLRFTTPARRMDELLGARQDLTEWLGIDPPAALAYPFGVPDADVDQETYAAAAAAGFRYAVLNAAGTVTSRTDRLRIPRIAAPNVGADEFAALLSGSGTRRGR
jgi:peptidoglycan/xylan/chitin deacetylase (PgdA/CDA1 family)